MLDSQAQPQLEGSTAYRRLSPTTRALVITDPRGARWWLSRPVRYCGAQSYRHIYVLGFSSASPRLVFPYLSGLH